MIRRRLVIREQVPGRLERLINKAGLSALHLRGISRPNALSPSFSRFRESDISMTDRALIKFSTRRILEFGERKDLNAERNSEEINRERKREEGKEKK